MTFEVTVREIFHRNGNLICFDDMEDSEFCVDISMLDNANLITAGANLVIKAEEGVFVRLKDDGTWWKEPVFLVKEVKSL